MAKYLDLTGLKYFITKRIGKTDISKIGDGTCTGAISALNQSLGNKIIKIKVSTTWNSDNKYYNKKDFPTLSPYMNDKYTLLNVINNCANTSNQVYGMSFCIVKGYRVPSDYSSICVVADASYNQVLTLDFLFLKL